MDVYHGRMRGAILAHSMPESSTPLSSFFQRGESGESWSHLGLPLEIQGGQVKVPVLLLGPRRVLLEETSG